MWKDFIETIRANSTIFIGLTILALILFLLRGMCDDISSLKKHSDNCVMQQNVSFKIADQLDKECDRRIALFKADWDKQPHWTEFVAGKGWGHWGEPGKGGFHCSVTVNDESNWVGKNFYLNEYGKIIDWESWNMIATGSPPTSRMIHVRTKVKFEGE